MNRTLQKPRKPLAPFPDLKISEVNIVTIPERCKGCRFCVELCPKDVLDYDDKLNAHSVHPPYVKDEEACVGCGLCEEICSDFAIFLRKKEVDKG